MFTTACLPMLMAKATLKLEITDDKRRRVCDLALVLEPFSAELAKELGHDIGWHLFTADGLMRAEVNDITIDPRVEPQRVIVASAADAPALATIKNADVSELSVVKKSNKDTVWYRATFTVRIDLGERAIREFLFHHFGEVRCFTFFAEQQALGFEEPTTALKGATAAHASH